MLELFIFSLSLFLTYIIKNYAIKKSLLAKVTKRSSHTVATPHGGGIAIAISWFIGITYLYFLGEMTSVLYFSLMLGIIISFVSYLDDLYELSAKIRLVTQAFVAFLGLYILGGFEEINFYFFTLENQILTNLFAFLMIIWFINLYNFLDGIDGYAGSEAVFLGLGGFIFFGGTHFLVLIFASLGFLVWNWHKAKIFMGDVGSTLLGYTIAIFTIHYANMQANNFWIWILLFSVFWMDATWTLLVRLKNKEKISQAHKKHIYQRLTQYGLSHDRVVVLAMGVNIVLMMIGYYIFNINR